MREVSTADLPQRILVAMSVELGSLLRDPGFLRSLLRLPRFTKDTHSESMVGSNDKGIRPCY